MILFDLENRREISRVASEARHPAVSSLASKQPLIVSGHTILLDKIELSTFEDPKLAQVHPSPDGLKVLLKVDNTIKIVFLHDMQKLKERIQTLPLESFEVAFCWFKDSEQVVIAYRNKFQVLNVFEPENMVLSEDISLAHDSFRYTPKVCFADRIVILRDASLRLLFYDVKRQKFIAQSTIDDIGAYTVIGENLIYSR